MQKPTDSPLGKPMGETYSPISLLLNSFSIMQTTFQIAPNAVKNGCIGTNLGAIFSRALKSEP
jgi:hypothetical protein